MTTSRFPKIVSIADVWGDCEATKLEDSEDFPNGDGVAACLKEALESDAVGRGTMSIWDVCTARITKMEVASMNAAVTSARPRGAEALDEVEDSV